MVDVNKGDGVHLEVRARLVAKETSRGRDMDLLAATPPIEAKTHVLFSPAVAEAVGYKRNEWACTPDVIDVRRAYVHAEARRKVYADLPQIRRGGGQVRKAKEGCVWH